MNEKQVNEVIELLWGITEKFDKLLDAVRKLPVAKAGDAGSQMSIDTGEAK